MPFLSSKPWNTTGLIKSICRKNALYRNYLHHNRDPVLHEKNIKQMHLIHTAETFLFK